MYRCGAGQQLRSFPSRVCEYYPPAVQHQMRIADQATRWLHLQRQLYFPRRNCEGVQPRCRWKMAEKCAALEKPQRCAITET